MNLCIYISTHIHVCVYRYVYQQKDNSWSDAWSSWDLHRSITAMGSHPSCTCARWHKALSLWDRNVPSQHWLQEMGEAFFLTSHGQEGTEINHQRHQCGEGRHSLGCVSQCPGQCGSSVASGCDPCLSLFLESLTYSSGLMWSRRNMDRWLPTLAPWFILILFLGVCGRLFSVNSWEWWFPQRVAETWLVFGLKV